MKPETKELLKRVDAGQIVAEGQYEMPGIIKQCYEWIGDGWGLERDDPTAPMIAAALFNEASDQDGYVERGESDATYPVSLRALAYKILETDGHNRPW